jgi:hypothetical protein
VELGTFFVAGMVISGGAVYYRFSGDSKTKAEYLQLFTS